jgi:hypothetical protein
VRQKYFLPLGSKFSCKDLQNLEVHISEGIVTQIYGSENLTDPNRAVEILRQLAADVRTLSRATVYYRVLMGRHLVAIQKNQLWRYMERRDYRQDPDGKPLWLSPISQTYSSWYNFIEEGFESITGLHRQTAYSAIKLAQASCLSALSAEELHNFKRLANALQLVSKERRGVEVTPELVIQAQEMSIKQFRQAVCETPPFARPTQKAPALANVIKLLRAVAAAEPKVIDRFWEIVRDAMTTADQNPVRAVGNIIASCSPLIRKPPEREKNAALINGLQDGRADNAKAVHAS